MLAHGAGAGKDSDFIRDIGNKITQAGQTDNRLNIQLIKFNFPYMEKILETGKRRPPDRMPKLTQSYLQQIESLSDCDAIFLAGKSMGGRVAIETSLLAKDLNIRGTIALGFPFHPIGKVDKHRLELLDRARLPALILQGERDTFGNREWVKQHNIPSLVNLFWIEAADHNLKPLKSASISYDQALALSADKILEFIRAYV